MISRGSSVNPYAHASIVIPVLTSFQLAGLMSRSKARVNVQIWRVGLDHLFFLPDNSFRAFKTAISNVANPVIGNLVMNFHMEGSIFSNGRR